MLTCPFWIASIKGVTPQLSLLSGLYWHLREKAKARTELVAGAKFSPSQLLCTGGAADHQWINEKIYRACLHTMQTTISDAGQLGILGSEMWYSASAAHSGSTDIFTSPAPQRDEAGRTKVHPDLAEEEILASHNNATYKINAHRSQRG